MERYSDLLRARASGIWTPIFDHPFLQAVAAGTLPLERFRFYLGQDYHFLGAYARAVALALAKAPDSATLTALARRVPTPVAREFHHRLFALLDLSEAEVEQVEIAPTTRAYMNHLIATASLGDVGATAAAILPCPWTYHLLGESFGPIEHPVYAAWAAVYQQGLLAESVRVWREFVDQAGATPANRPALEAAFLTSSRYEYLFWQMGYQGEAWPV